MKTILITWLVMLPMIFIPHSYCAKSIPFSLPIVSGTYCTEFGYGKSVYDVLKGKQ